MFFNKWGGIVFAIGIALIIIDIMMSKKKKGGVTATDKQRFVGIFWLTLFVSVGVMALIWLMPSS